jgi:hypothetical protein
MAALFARHNRVGTTGAHVDYFRVGEAWFHMVLLTIG